MNTEVLSPLDRAARCLVAGVLLGLSLPALAQDASTPPPANDQTQSAPAEATPPAPTGTPDVIPVQSDAAPEAAPAPTAKDSTQLETIEVTGSRLKRTDYESAQPVVSISREDIERSGLTDISQVLRQLTVAGNNSLTTAEARFSLSLGETNIDLRNLGAQHTLLLVNGRRWITGLNSTSTSVSDLNTIPTSIIERVEVLKDGASAVYGSDAIAGVVNIITRKDYQGVGIDYHLGQYYQQGDGTNQQVSLNLGNSSPGSNLFMNLSYTNQERAPVENRAFTASPYVGASRDSPITTRGTFNLINPTSSNGSFYGCPAAIGQNEPIPGGGIPGGPNNFGAGVQVCTLERNVGAADNSSMQSDYHQYDTANPDPADVYNRFANGTLTEPSTRSALFIQYNQDLLDRVTMTLEGLYNTRQSTQVGQNGYLVGGNYTPGFPKGAAAAFISASAPNNPFGQDIGKDDTCTDQNAPSCSKLGTGSGVWRIRQGGDADNELFLDQVHTMRLGVGLKGDFEALNLPLSWDGGYIFGSNQIEEKFTTPRFDREAQALGNVGTCVAPCVPLDVFHGAAGLTQAMINWVFYDAYTRNSNRQDIAYADLSSELPTGGVLPGPVAVALGAELRRDVYVNVVDPVIQRGDAFINSLTNTDGRTFAREAYVELGAPLLKDLPFAQDVDIDVAGRYSQYPRFGAVTTGKAGLRWKPVADLLLRSTYSTGFRAPALGELYLGSSQSFDGISDPCTPTPTGSPTNPNPPLDQNCALDGATAGGAGVNGNQLYDQWVGNPNLKPESSKNLTYGLVFAPSSIPDLSLSLDFYRISVKNYITIGGQVGQFFLDSCEETPRPTGAQANSGPYCGYIHRDANGVLLFVDTPWFNLASVDTSGVDGGLEYLLPLPAALGRFRFTIDTSYLEKFNDTLPPVAGKQTVQGAVGQEGAFVGYPRLKAGSALAWQGELYSASWTTRMAYHMNEACQDFFGSLPPGVCNNPKTDAAGNDVSENMMKTVFYHNAQVGRQLPALHADISLGVNNVFNQNPAYSHGIAGLIWYNYDPNQYEVPGRLGYMKISIKF